MNVLARFVIGMTAKWYNVVAALVVTQFAAVVIMMLVEGWGFMDSLWWAHVASLTIGYGDIAPKTDIGRTLAISFQYFWIYYCGLAIGAHFVIHLFKNLHLFTHFEQEWLLKTLRIIFDWVRWMVMALFQIAQKVGVTIDPPPHIVNGQLVECPPEPRDTDFGDLTPQQAAQQG